MPRPTLRVLVTVALVTTIGVVAAGCAGSGNNGSGPHLANTTQVPPHPSIDPSTSATTTSAGTTRTTVTTINRTVWFAGFKLTVKTATLKAEPELGGGTVELAVAFTNLGSDPVRFDGQLALGWGGSNDEFDITALPRASAGDTSDATLTFSVNELFKFDNAVLTVGAAGHHQAIVPLGSTGQLVDLVPVRVAVNGLVTGGNLKANVTGAELRADVVKSHLELDQDQEALFLTADITWNGPSTYTLSRNNFALLLPNGTQITADEGPIDILGPGGAKTNATVRFTVPEPASGSYQLIIRDPTATHAQGQLPFVVAVNNPNSPSTQTGSSR